jgi:hypothetical protein
MSKSCGYIGTSSADADVPDRRNDTLRIPPPHGGRTVPFMDNLFYFHFENLLCPLVAPVVKTLKLAIYQFFRTLTPNLVSKVLYWSKCHSISNQQGQK